MNKKIEPTNPVIAFHTRRSVLAPDDTEVRGTAIHPQKYGYSKNGMVSTAHYEATRAGVQILEQGGNAVDAAVASAFTLGVCEPAASGLGGQTMMLVYNKKRRQTVALDGSSRAPNRAIVSELSSGEMRRGYRATTVPSTPATLAYALDKFGSMSLQQVLEPAISCADRGYRVSELQRQLARRVRGELMKNHGASEFLRDGKNVHAVGALFCQPALAETMRRLAKHGVDDFYTGKIAKVICADMQRNQGLLHPDDLANIPWPIERRPVSCNFEGMRVMSMPPPGAGRTLIEMLNIIRNFPKRRRLPDSPQGAIVLAEVIRQGLIDRKDRPADPDFFSQVSERSFVKEEYGKKIAKTIRSRLRTRGETTHLSVMDRWGNVVGLTQSIEQVYGSCVATSELGFLYNNYMSAFAYDDMSHPYYLRPNGVPWASVAPTIVFFGSKPWLVIGSPGSERIVSSILQVMLRLDHQDPMEAVAAPRLHCSLHGKVSIEASKMRSDIPLALQKHGFSLDLREPDAFYLGCVQLVMREDDGWIGVADPRRDGAAAGPSQ